MWGRSILSYLILMCGKLWMLEIVVCQLVVCQHGPRPTWASDITFPRKCGRGLCATEPWNLDKQNRYCGSQTAQPRGKTPAKFSEPWSESVQCFMWTPKGGTFAKFSRFQWLEKMRGRFKRRDLKEKGDERADFGAGFPPLSGEPAAGSVEPYRPVAGLGVQAVAGRKKGGTTGLTDFQFSGRYGVFWLAVETGSCCYFFPPPLFNVTWVHTVKVSKRLLFYTSPFIKSC